MNLSAATAEATAEKYYHNSKPQNSLQASSGKKVVSSTSLSYSQLHITNGKTERLQKLETFFLWIDFFIIEQLDIIKKVCAKMMSLLFFLLFADTSEYSYNLNWIIF